MAIVRLSRRAKRLIADRVITRAARAVVVSGIPTANRATAIEIQAKLDAARPETLRPIERSAGLEVVPFQTDSISSKLP